MPGEDAKVLRALSGVDFGKDPNINSKFEENKTKMDRSVPPPDNDFTRFSGEWARASSSVDGQKADSMLKQARLLSSHGPPRLAENFFSAALSLRERLFGRDSFESLEIKRGLGSCLLKQRCFEEAETVLTECCSSWSLLMDESLMEHFCEMQKMRSQNESESAEAFLNLSQVKVRLSKDTDAETFSQAAVYIAEKSAKMAFVAAEDCADGERKVLAVKQAISKGKNAGRFLAHHGVILAKLQRWEEAIDFMEVSIQADSLTVELKTSLALFRVEENQLDEALMLMREVLASNLLI